MAGRTPGFITGRDKIVPAGSWCCIITTRLGGTSSCTPYIRTNRFFAWTACSAQAVAMGGEGTSATLRGCPQDARTCCPAVGCYR